MARSTVVWPVALSAALAVAGCGGLSSFTGAGGSPFSNASSNDLLFVSAAPTWDLDKNNAVTCEEWQRYLTELFTEADANKDGALTKEEYQTVIKADRLFQSADHAYYDANKDGKVMLQEMTSKQNPAFAILDKNKDCQIGSDEIVQTSQVQQLKTKGDSAPSDLPGGGPGGTGSPGGR